MTVDKITLYRYWFILPSILWIGPTPCHEKALHTITLSHPCFMVLIVYMGLHCWFGGRLTYVFPSDPSLLNIDSSLHIFFIQKESGLFKCCLASAILFYWLALESSGFFCAMHPLKLNSFNRRRTVLAESSISNFSAILNFISSEERKGSRFANLPIALSSVFNDFLGGAPQILFSNTLNLLKCSRAL